MLVNGYSVGECLSRFLENGTSDSCEILSNALIPIVKKSIEDFRVVGRFKEMMSEVSQSGYDLSEQLPTPDADDIQSAVVFESFKVLLPYFNPNDILHSDAVYCRTIESALGLPESQEQFFEQKALSVIRLLVLYWFSNHQNHFINHFTDAILSLMKLISDFQTAVGDLPLDYPGRSRGIKLIWRLRDEVVFSIDRIGRKFSKSCFKEHASMGGLGYEMDLLMEKIEVLIDSERSKVIASSEYENIVYLVGLIDAMSSGMIDQHRSASLILSRESQDSEYTACDVPGLYNGNHFALSLNSLAPFLQGKLQQYHDSYSDPIAHCVLKEVSLLLGHVLDYETFLHQASHDPWHQVDGQGGKPLNIVNVLLSDIAAFVDKFMDDDIKLTDGDKKLQADEQALAHRMLEHIAYYQKMSQGFCSAHVMAPLDALVSRLEYVLYEQSIFLNAYSNLLTSVEEFDGIIESLSPEKQAMIRPYSHNLRSYAADYAVAVSEGVEKPRRYTVDPAVTQEFQVKMGKVIEQADRCLSVHRHPLWFRTAVRLMMSVTHFIASCLTAGPRHVYHKELSSQLYHSDYLPASSVFANTSIHQLSQSMVMLGHDIHH